MSHCTRPGPALAVPTALKPSCYVATHKHDSTGERYLPGQHFSAEAFMLRGNTHARAHGGRYLPGQHFVQQDAVGPPVHGSPVRLIRDYLCENKHVSYI